MVNFEATMSKRKSKKKQPAGKSSPGDKQRGLKISVAVAALAAVAFVAVALYVARDKAQEEKQETPTFADSAKPKAFKIDLNRLLGRWLRPDGGYVIEIQRIGANGRLDAAYFNPHPINVSRAEASHEENEIKVFIELQDVGYPGSIYHLVYDPQGDVLSGTYFHAGLNQTFDVVFVRTN
jgi:hypothetical protein